MKSRKIISRNSNEKCRNGNLCSTFYHKRKGHCGIYNKTKTIFCTRAKYHKGKHVGCGTTHNIDIWKNFILTNY